MDDIEDTVKAEHKILAEFVKGVHADLRKRFKKGDTVLEEVWKEHCSNETILKQYAESMHKLATEHWSSQPQSRIEWCRQAISSYYREGGLRKCLEKEQRRAQREGQTCSSELGINDFSEKSESQCPNKLISTIERYENNCSLRLLDVGSCYNPFSEFDEFDSVGIDLCPANENVHRCDFLNIQIGDIALEEISLSNSIAVANPHSLVTSLPAQSFDVVVFSLLLEYLPSPSMRWCCCKNAFELLRLHGILIIITPDSHKQHRNSDMIKSWKQAIEALGFTRWKYEKLEHIHCMVFRKTGTDIDESLDNEKTREMLFIHQDFLQEVNEGPSYVHVDESNFMECLNELPYCETIDETNEMK